MGRPRGRGKGKQRRNDDFERQTPHPTPGQPTPHPTPHTPHPTPHTPQLTSLLKTYPYELGGIPLALRVALYFLLQSIKD
ncbi:MULTISPECIES: hypothetical protein [Moorena]|uniref:hypothetical protein n=1 Tax=Moorena TaxID=1155738 RepID=UPI0003023896|nr:MULTISPECIES: hypothetical protein [Moorena]NER90613.1 hypothetical protein [Moorena sp. SIO3A2]